MAGKYTCNKLGTSLLCGLHLNSPVIESIAILRAFGHLNIVSTPLEGPLPHPSLHHIPVDRSKIGQRGRMLHGILRLQVNTASSY